MNMKSKNKNLVERTQRSLSRIWTRGESLTDVSKWHASLPSRSANGWHTTSNSSPHFPSTAPGTVPCTATAPSDWALSAGDGFSSQEIHDGLRVWGRKDSWLVESNSGLGLICYCAEPSPSWPRQIYISIPVVPPRQDRPSCWLLWPPSRGWDKLVSLQLCLGPSSSPGHEQGPAAPSHGITLQWCIDEGASTWCAPLSAWISSHSSYVFWHPVQDFNDLFRVLFYIWYLKNLHIWIFF